MSELLLENILIFIDNLQQLIIEGQQSPTLYPASPNLRVYIQALIKLPPHRSPYQWNLTEREGSVQLTSLY
jgi:hypothetical protein